MTVREDLGAIFRKYDMNGAFVMYDPQSNSRIYYNRSRCAERFIPASTYKIPHSLIALETGVIEDEKTIIPWDSVRRSAGWDQDHNMAMAMERSTVWFYQVIARRIGPERMQRYLDTMGYGNRDISGGIDRFWLDGGLRISPDEQIGFLQRLHDNKLPFSQRSMDIVKRIILREDTLGYRFSYKTGWAPDNGIDLGWVVGWVEKEGKVYYFAVNCERREQENGTFPADRIKAAREILSTLGLIRK